MKRKVSKVLSVLLIAALMLSFTAVASAETRMYATSAVNVRSGPGTSYYIIGSLEQNEMVTATGRAYNGWYEIAWGSYGYGYVAGNYLSYSKYEPGYNTGCYPSRRGVTLKVCQDCGDIYYATTALNVRQGPGTKYSIVGSLNRGQQCTAIGKSGNWYKLLTADGSTARYAEITADRRSRTVSLRFNATPCDAPLCVKAYTADGREILRQSLGICATGSRRTLNLPASSGIYIIQIETETGSNGMQQAKIAM